VRRWAAFFEMDKALYEIDYELHQRPDWIWIPLRGARQLIETHLPRGATPGGPRDRRGRGAPS
jgi:predicted trehalose synthase